METKEKPNQFIASEVEDEEPYIDVFNMNFFMLNTVANLQSMQERSQSRLSRTLSGSG